MSIPITLVTGFLGAGKSTLINRVVAENPSLKFGLVVNEFGDVKLESQVIEAEDDAITELSNGCMCCVVRSDLVGSVKGLLKRNPRLGHVIMEASGLSDPVPIANTFLNDDLGGKVEFDAVVCVVDALNFRASLAAYPVSRVQIEYADFVLLSKAELAGPEATAATRAAVLALNPRARILALGEDFPTNLVFDTAGIDHADLASLRIAEHHHHGEGHDHGAEGYAHVHEEVDTLFFSSDQPFDLDRFGAFLKELPETVYRAKGFLQFSDPGARGRKYLLQMVGSRPLLDARPWRKGERPTSALVLIGKGFDRNRLEARLISCLDGRGAL